MRKNYTTTPQTKTQVEKFPITALTFNNNTNTLILGDEFGKIEIWDLNPFLEKLKKIDDEEKKKKKAEMPGS